MAAISKYWYIFDLLRRTSECENYGTALSSTIFARDIFVTNRDVIRTVIDIEYRTRH